LNTKGGIAKSVKITCKFHARLPAERVQGQSDTPRFLHIIRKGQNKKPPKKPDGAIEVTWS